MATIPVRKVDAQIQLSDDVKRQFPNDAVVSLFVQQLLNFPSLSGSAGKALVGNSTETGLTFQDLPPGLTGTTFTLVTDFPASPNNNQLIFLTQKRGTSDIGFYQYRTSTWVSIFVKSDDFTLPVGTALPAVATAGSVFFLTQTYLTNSPGVYYRNAGPPAEWVVIASAQDNSIISQTLALLTSRVSTLERDNPVTSLSINGNTLTFTKKDNTTEDIELPISTANPIVGVSISGNTLTLTRQDNSTFDIALPAPSGGTAQLQETGIFYGVTAVKASVDDDDNSVANARTEGLAAFNIQANRTAKNITLQTGGYISITFPNATGWYRPFIAIPTASITNLLIQSIENNFETSEWTTITATLNAINYTIYVRTTESEEGGTEQWIIKNYS